MSLSTPVAADNPSRLARRNAVLPWITTLLRLVLAAIWGYAGLSKITDPEATVRAVRAYQLLPESVVSVVGYGLPFVEIGLAILLVLGIATRVLGGVCALLFVAFLVGIISAAARGLTIDCGCFGGGGQVASGATRYGTEIARDAGFLVMALWLLVLPGSRLALDSKLAAPTFDADDRDDDDSDDVNRDDEDDPEGIPPR